MKRVFKTRAFDRAKNQPGSDFPPAVIEAAKQTAEDLQTLTLRDMAGPIRDGRLMEIAMAPKDPEEARMLSDLLEFSEDLNSYGLMSKSSMAKIRSLCAPPPLYTSEQIAAIRTRVAKMSQSVFAAFLNVSVSTVQKWESPRANKQPTGTALRLLQLVESKGVEALIA